MESKAIRSYEAWNLSHGELLNKLLIARLDIDKLNVESICLGDGKECGSSGIALVRIK